MPSNNNSRILNSVIHERVRLLILTFLASYESNELVFKELQKRLELTAGNLSVQLKTLEKHGYVLIRKEFVANKPQTSISITSEGRKALEEYLSEMEQIIHNIKNNNNLKPDSGTADQ